MLGTFALLCTIKKTVVRHYQMSPGINAEVLVKLSRNALELLLHGVEIDNGTDSDNADCLGIEDA